MLDVIKKNIYDHFIILGFVRVLHGLLLLPFIHSIFVVKYSITLLFLLITEKSISHTWAQVEDSQRRELLLQAFRKRCILGREVLSDDIQEISKHCQELEQMAR